MNVKPWPTLLLLCLSGCAVERPYQADEKPWDSDPVQIHGVPGLMYIRGDGRAGIMCSLSSPTECGDLDTFGMTEQIFLDCSDEEFQCLFNRADVLAIPRSGLVEGQEYTAFGANLTVERCFGEEGSCEIAMIKSKCKDSQTCSCRSEVLNRTTTFYFSNELGVTAFYTVGAHPFEIDPQRATQLVTDSIPLLTYVLVAEKGFLRTDLPLRRAPVGCGNG